METAVSAATWLVGKVLEKLSNDLVGAYVASLELGLNSDQIKTDLMFTHGLLHAAQGRDYDNPGLKGLLEQLSEKAGKAEDALDELHYFMIQDRLDDTHHATPDLGGGLHEKIQHGRNAIHHTTGNWFSCFSCCRTTDDIGGSGATAIPDDDPHNKAKTNSGSGQVDKLKFGRVAMSIKIKSVIEDIHSKCTPVSELLKISSHSSTTGTTSATLKRPVIGSTVVQDKLYGRTAIFEQTIKDITSASETLSVLPIVGPGGIGKTTFTQHVYNDERTKEHFPVRVWICVSTEFDVLKLTQQIHSCIPPTENKESSVANEEPNLDQLQISIARRLKSKRFLIVLDDIWKCDSVHEWKTLLAPFTEGEAKGSIVLVTTRFPKIEERVKKATIPVNLRGLDPQEFLDFFQECVFGDNKPDQQYSEIVDIARDIAMKLKGSPLAAKTVARLLRKNLSWEHWRRVLENNEWENQTHNDDIMPALKISYDYLPFHLKQCFSYFALFPEDHWFKSLEITCFWTAIGIIDSSCKSNSYLEELVENGFLVKKVDDLYTMHDLLHELSRSVSSQECANISSLSFRASNIPSSIRHLSITIKDRYDENFSNEMAKLKNMINIENIWTLMIFRNYEVRIDKILKDTFEEAKGLRILFIVMNSPSSLPKNFSKLLHLRYLKIAAFYDQKMSLPSTLPRFYHLTFLDLQNWCGSSKLPEHFSRLVNLRHFIASDKLHSNVSEVGKIEHLEELKEFHVKKETVGFELEELGKLINLGGQLTVRNLEKVVTKEEAGKANLALKRNLKKLILVWGAEQPGVDVDIVDGLRPHDNLRELEIIDGGASIGLPSWLFRDVPMKHLDSLTLDGVSWVILPPFVQLPYLKSLRLKSTRGVRVIGHDLGFMHIKEVMLIDMPDLEEWAVGPNCQSFPMLESIMCMKCPNIRALPFSSEWFVPCSTPKVRYPSLREFVISRCPMLSLPPMPHTSTQTYVDGDDIGSMRYDGDGDHLELHQYSGALSLRNMGKVERFNSEKSKIPWTDFPELTSLREVRIITDPSLQSMAPFSGLTSLTKLELIDCHNLTMDGFNPRIIVNLKSLTVYNQNKNSPRSIAADLLSEIAISSSRVLVAAAAAGSCLFQLEELQVDSISGVLVGPMCSLLSSNLRTLKFSCDHQRVEGLNEEEEKALQLLTSLKILSFDDCWALTSLPQGLHTLPSLEELQVTNCPEIWSVPEGALPPSLRVLTVRGIGFMEYRGDHLDLHQYSGALFLRNMGKLESLFSDESKIPWTDFAELTSLRKVCIINDPSLQSMAPFSGLTSLTSLSLVHCNNLTMDGFNPLIIANLKNLTVYNNVKENGPCCRSIAADLLSEVAIYCMRSSRPVGGSALLQLEQLKVDSISGVLVAPICSLLSSTLRTLMFVNNCQRVEGLNEEEEKALQLLTSLRALYFSNCTRLTSLPQGLHTLASLRELSFHCCPALTSLPQGLHTLPSLEQLYVHHCPEVRSLPKGGLPSSLRVLSVFNCSAQLQEHAKILKQQGANPYLKVEIPSY